MKQNFNNLCPLLVGLLALLSVTLCCCEDARIPLTDEAEPASPDISVPLGLNSVASEDSGISGASGGTGASITTRVGTTSLETTKRIGFYVKIPVVAPGSSVLTYEEKGNVSGGYDKVKKWWAPDQTIWISNRNSVMTVYAPYDPAQPAKKISLAAALPKSDGSNDLLAGTMNVNSLNVSAAGGVSITLSHLYTCLQFSFTKNDNFETAGSTKYVMKIAKLELLGADMYATADYDPYTKTYSSAARTDVALAVSPAVTVPNAASVTSGTAAAVISTLLIPMRQAFTADVTLKITVNSTQGAQTIEKTLSVKIPKTTFNNSRPFAPGKQYNFKVKLSPTQEMEIEGVEVADWLTGTTVDSEPMVD